MLERDRDAETQRLIAEARADERDTCIRLVESLARDERVSLEHRAVLQIAVTHLRARGGQGGV